jgi:hypothetical protein
MITNSILIYFLIIITTLGILLVIFFKVNFGIAEMESQLSGIWVNGANTMRILIYSLNSEMRGDLIWTNGGNDRILGSTVLQGLKLSAFGWSKGIYVDPVTKGQIDFKLKLKAGSRLCVRFFERPDQLQKEENWTPAN